MSALDHRPSDASSASAPLIAQCPAVRGGVITLADGGMLIPVAVHRLLPGRRWVFSAQWQGKAVFAKLFLGAQAARYAQRDAQGALAMQQSGVRTPALLWQGQAAGPSQEILIYEAVMDADSADVAYASEDAAGKLHLMQQLVCVLAQQHAAGLVQTDLHLKNFLLASSQVWAIDGDGIRRKVLTPQQAYHQLAQLISNVPVLDQHAGVAAWLAAYQQQRAWSDGVHPEQLLAWANRSKFREVQAFVTQKIFRNCTAVVWQQQPTFVSARNAAVVLPEVDPALLEAAMRQGQMLKDGNSSTVVRARLAQQAVVIKRYNIKHFWHGLSRCWRSSRAASSWSNAHRLQYYGFLTPQPLVMLEQRRWSLRHTAYFVSAWNDDIDAVTFFRQSTLHGLRDTAIQQLAMTCYQFYLLGIVHGDMKATNLHIDPQGQVVVMDLDSMQQFAPGRRALRGHVTDIRRLLQNWKDDTSLYNALVQGFNAVYVDKTPLGLAGISI